MASKPSIQELMAVLQKSGLPMGDSFGMGQAAPGARDTIAPIVRGADTRTPQLKSNYQSQLAQIAAMDEKLAQVYGDPTSKMFIERASTRERAISGAAETGYDAAGGIAKDIKISETEVDKQVDEALALYKQLASAQAAEEREVARATREGEKVEAKTPGAKKAQARAAKKPAKGKVTLKATPREKVAGFADGAAAKAWTNKEEAFKKHWVENILRGGPESIPEGGFTIEDVDENYESWKKFNAEEKAKKKANSKSSSKSKLDQIIDNALDKSL